MSTQTYSTYANWATILYRKTPFIGQNKLNWEYLFLSHTRIPITLALFQLWLFFISWSTTVSRKLKKRVSFKFLPPAAKYVYLPFPLHFLKFFLLLLGYQWKKREEQMCLFMQPLSFIFIQVLQHSLRMMWRLPDILFPLHADISESMLVFSRDWVVLRAIRSGVIMIHSSSLPLCLTAALLKDFSVVHVLQCEIFITVVKLSCWCQNNSILDRCNCVAWLVGSFKIFILSLFLIMLLIFIRYFWLNNNFYYN